MVGDAGAPFRAILPALGRATNQSGEDGPDDAGYNSSPVANQRRLLKRIRSVAQACHMCRQTKAKCDGGRPRCGNCIDRDRPCGYEGEAGQSRQAAMRARLAAFEAVFASLRTATPAETERLLQRLRTMDDPVSILREEGGGSPGPASNSAPASSTATSENTQHASPRVSPSRSTSMGSGAEMSTSPRQSVDLLLNNSPSFAAPVAMELVFPDYTTTTAAVAEFYSNRGTLFPVFPEDQTSRFCDIIFGATAYPTSLEEKNVAMSCLAGVVAVGMRFSPSSSDRLAGNATYDIAKQHFELILDTSPFLAIKLAALLAMFNIMSRNTMALIWVGIGLRLCRTCSLANKTPSDPNISLAEWTEHRKAWRTLVFMSCWLAFAMCSTTGQEVEFEKTSPATIEFESSPDIKEILQTESTKISILNVEILRIHLTFKKITVLSFESVMRDLQSWHDKLPAHIHLGSVQDRVLSPDVRRSVYHLHLLYEGAVLLIYRRMASQYNYTFNQQASRQILEEGPESLPVALLKQGVEAARRSAVVFSLLLQDDAMSRRCWIVILQAYASCIVLLHIAAQKQAHGCHWETWQGDLRRAEVCLQVLDHNGAADDAKDFHGKLFPLFHKLSKAQMPFESRPGRIGLHDGHESNETVPLLLTLPASASGEHAGISLELLAMLGQPFRNLRNESGKLDEGRTTMDASSLELPQISGLGW